MEGHLDSPRESSPSGTWTFAPFTLDAARHHLQRAGEEVALDRAAIDILVALLGHHGEVVTKDELLEAAWPGRIVGENSLTKAIGRLRSAIGEERVATVHGYGYKFAGEVRFRPAADVHGAAKQQAFHAGDPVPQRKGWLLLRHLGSGGFGEVWVAQSTDRRETRAIKFASDENALRALKREVALHRLIETSSGARSSVVGLCGWNLVEPPFFVEMPVVENGNLREWAESEDRLRKLSLDVRLELMARLTENVARIHALGIIHKDLKPENILIDSSEDGSPRPLLTDFGGGWVARYGPGHPAFPLSNTFANTLRDSPRLASALYAAPETLRAETPTIQADVYSLGVLLYQIVVGDLKRPLSPGWERDVPDELIRTDIQDAAEQDRGRRLGSAQMLAERLRALPQRRRSLEEDRQREQARISEKRRSEQSRLQRKIGIAIAAALIAGLLSTSAMYWRAEKMREATAQEAHRAQAMLDFITNDILATGDPYGDQAKEITVRDAVDRSAQQLDYRFGDNPAAKIAMHRAIAKVYDGIGDYKQSVTHFNAAAATAEREDSERPLLPRILTELAQASIDGDRLDEADSALVRATTAAAASTEPGKNGLYVLAAIAQLRFEQGRFRPGQAAARQVIDAGPTQDVTVNDPYANALWYGALASEALGDFDESERDYRELIVLRDSELGPAHPYTAWAWSGYGALLSTMGRSAEAETALRKSMTLFDAALGTDHPDTTSPRFHLAELYAMQARWSDAIPLLEDIVRKRRQKLGETHTWTTFASLALANTYAGAGQIDDAERLLALVRPASEHFDNEDLNVYLLQAEASLDYLHKSFDQASAKNRALAQTIKQAYSERHPRYAMTECQAARILLAQGQYNPALERVMLCRNMLAERVRSEHPYRLQADALLADIQRAMPKHTVMQ